MLWLLYAFFVNKFDSEDIVYNSFIFIFYLLLISSNIYVSVI